MPVAFAKVAGNIHRNRKVRKAGRDALAVYQWVLCQNALQDRAGHLPLSDLTDSEWLADELMCEPEEAATGFDRAIKHGLLAIEGELVFIVGWNDEWAKRPLTNAERQARHRMRGKPGETTTASNEAAVTSNDNAVTSNGKVTRNESNVVEESREEESRGEARKPRPSRRKPQAALPETWSPTVDARERAAAAGLSLEVEVEKFRNWAAQADRRYSDWDATFRNWIARANEFRRGNSQRQEPMRLEPKRL